MAYNEGASSGNLVLIQSQTGSSSSELDFTTGLSGFDNYYLMFNKVTTDIGGSNLYIQFSTDGGATYSGTTYITTGWGSIEGSGLGNIDYTNLIGCLVTNSDSSLDPKFTLDGYAFLYNLNSNTLTKNIITNSICVSNSGGGHNASQQINTNWQTTTAVNALRVLFDGGGSIVTGTFKLYGVQN